MDESKRYLDPDELTPEERLSFIIKLLAKAGVRLALKEKESGELVFKEPPISLDSLLPAESGQIPFGMKSYGLNRVVNKAETKWIKRIQELNESGLSTEKIAKVLNIEDKKSKWAGKWSRTAVWRIMKHVEEERRPK